MLCQHFTTTILQSYNLTIFHRSARSSRARPQHDRSREASSPPRFAHCALAREGAERRQALGCSGTLWRASDAGPQALARRLAPSDVGRSPLGAPPRGLGRPVPRKHSESSDPKHHASSSRPLIVRRAGFRSLPGVACKATRGTPHPDLLMQCLATSTLGGRDDGNIVIRKLAVKFFAPPAPRRG
jgi:hypothetical protein